MAIERDIGDIISEIHNLFNIEIQELNSRNVRAMGWLALES